MGFADLGFAFGFPGAGLFKAAFGHAPSLPARIAATALPANRLVDISCVPARNSRPDRAAAVANPNRPRNPSGPEGLDLFGGVAAGPGADPSYGRSSGTTQVV
jgi:hypothetical protein